MTDEIDKDAKKIICRLYHVQHVDTVNMAQPLLFIKSHAPKSLPPTNDALSFHVKH
jgi:hypothetical protein